MYDSVVLTMIIVIFVAIVLGVLVATWLLKDVMSFAEHCYKCNQESCGR